MAIIEGDRYQHTLLPACVDDYIGEEDPVRAYDAFVDALDLESLGLTLDHDGPGHPPYDPRAMLKLLIYGYSYGIRSARKLERAVHHNLSFIWLVGGLKPDYRSIARFRADNTGVLQQVLKSSARMCLKLDLIKGNVLFVDGSKFRGNCAIAKQIKPQRGKQLLRNLDQRIDRLLKDCARIDRAEEADGSLVEMNKDLARAEALRERVKACVEELEETGETSINLTDRDAIAFKGRQGSHAGYNVQAVVDGEHGLVVSADAVSEPNDRGQLDKQVKQAESTLDTPAETVCADSGYENIEAQKPLLDADKAVVVPSQQQAGGEEPGPFDARRFEYDEENDCYICPMGKVLKHSTFDKNSNKHTYRIASKRDCLSCEHFGNCTTNRRGRAIRRHAYQADKARIEALYQLPESQEIYRQRKLKAELPFGHAKHNLHANQLLLRGREGARAECSLLFSAFNIRRMITLLGGVKAFRQAVANV